MRALRRRRGLLLPLLQITRRCQANSTTATGSGAAPLPSGLDSILEDHIANGRTLLLPIVDEEYGLSVSRRFKQQDVGSFVLMSYSSGRELELELIALGAVPTENLCYPLP